jgi:hypothetical protein
VVGWPLSLGEGAAASNVYGKLREHLQCWWSDDGNGLRRGSDYAFASHSGLEPNRAIRLRHIRSLVRRILSRQVRVALQIEVAKMSVFYSPTFWAQIIPYLAIVSIFGLLRFRATIRRPLWWLAFLVCGAVAVVVARNAVGEIVTSESTFWWWTYYLAAAVVLDRAKLSQLEGRKTIL